MSIRKLRVVDGCWIDILTDGPLKNVNGSRVDCYCKEHTECTVRCAHFWIDNDTNFAYCGDKVIIGEIVKYETHQEVDRQQMEKMALEHETYKNEPCTECIHRGICVMLLGIRWGDYPTCHWKPSHFRREGSLTELKKQLVEEREKIAKVLKYLRLNTSGRTEETIFEMLTEK